jgi:hypothetical protein
MMWATEQEARDEFRASTLPGCEGLSIIEAIERARQAQQQNEQRHDVQLEIQEES